MTMKQLYCEFRLLAAQWCLGWAVWVAPKDHLEGVALILGVGATVAAMADARK